MYSDILYPTDGSEGAQAALDTVRDLSETYEATVHLLFVGNTTHDAFGLGQEPETHETGGMVGHPEGGGAGMVGDRSTIEEFRERLDEHGREMLDRVAEQLGEADTTRVVRHGDPHEVILNYAEGNDIDMIVMGTHGRSGLDRYLLGSVTEKTVRMSDVPVLTIRLSDPA